MKDKINLLTNIVIALTISLVITIMMYPLIIKPELEFKDSEIQRLNIVNDSLDQARNTKVLIEFNDKAIEYLTKYNHASVDVLVKGRD